MRLSKSATDSVDAAAAVAASFVSLITPPILLLTFNNSEPALNQYSAALLKHRRIEGRAAVTSQTASETFLRPLKGRFTSKDRREPLPLPGARSKRSSNLPGPFPIWLAW